MKPLLRVVLIVDALLLAAFGVLFLLTPWASLYDALQLVRPQPTLVGQAFGFVLIGLGWLAAHAAFDGALTASIGKVIGHVNWMLGVLMLVWLIGLHTPAMTGFSFPSRTSKFSPVTAVSSRASHSISSAAPDGRPGSHG